MAQMDSEAQTERQKEAEEKRREAQEIADEAIKDLQDKPVLQSDRVYMANLVCGAAQCGKELFYVWKKDYPAVRQIYVERPQGDFMGLGTLFGGISAVGRMVEPLLEEKGIILCECGSALKVR